MLVTIGGGPRAAGDLVDALLECHERIRRFIAMASAAGARRELPDAEVVATCARVEHYFRESLPLHMADEELSILPRLRGQDAELDRALALMAAQHDEHESSLNELHRALARVQKAPGDSGRRTLAAVAGRLEIAFAEHLRLEESTIFPALRRLLPMTLQEEIRREMRQRR